jgi:hypothetical protein
VCWLTLSGVSAPGIADQVTATYEYSVRFRSQAMAKYGVDTHIRVADT